MSRWFAILVGCGFLVTIVAALGLWHLYLDDTGKHATFVGVLYTTVLGLLAVFIAILIYRRQEITQKSFQDEQSRRQQEGSELQDAILRRLFGTIEGFDEVYSRATDLIKEANERQGSDLAVMVYWLWFGADRRLRDAPEERPEAIKASDSDVFELLNVRHARGEKTLVVAYNPTDDPNIGALRQLSEFVMAALQWQLREAKSQRVLTEGDVRNLLKKYALQIREFDRRGSEEKRSTRFVPLVLKAAVPMLMFAVTHLEEKTQKTWCRALVCLAETEALKAGAPVGGFESADPRFVAVVMRQINAFAGINSSHPARVTTAPGSPSATKS